MIEITVEEKWSKITSVISVHSYNGELIKVDPGSYEERVNRAVEFLLTNRETPCKPNKNCFRRSTHPFRISFSSIRWKFRRKAAARWRIAVAYKIPSIRPPHGRRAHYDSLPRDRCPSFCSRWLIESNLRLAHGERSVWFRAIIFNTPYSAIHVSRGFRIYHDAARNSKRFGTNDLWPVCGNCHTCATLSLDGGISTKGHRDFFLKKLNHLTSIEDPNRFDIRDCIWILKYEVTIIMMANWKEISYI